MRRTVVEVGRTPAPDPAYRPGDPTFSDPTFILTAADLARWSVNPRTVHIFCT